jgi:cytochrome P450
MGDVEQLLQYPIVQNDDLTVDPAYLEMQQRGPVRVQLPYGEPCWVATRYEDVKTVYGDRRFVKALGYGRDTPRVIPNMTADPSMIAQMDPPQHTRIRRLTSGAFSVPQMRATTGRVEAIFDGLADEMIDRGEPADFIDTVAWTLPLRVLTGVLGVSDADIPTFRGWVERTITPDAGAEGLEDAARLVSYIEGLIADRRERPTDDLLSMMVGARDHDERLNEAELVSLALVLFIAGFETTAAQIGSSIHTLMAHRHLWDELVAAPELLPTAIEELWRWIPSFRHGVPMIRWASEDIELSSGVVIPAGEAVVPEHQVAHRDESAFPHAAELDFHRRNPNPHLSLAWGPHRCMGAHLANLEISVVLQGMLRRFPNLELAEPAAEVTWSSTTFLRSPERLLITW